LLETHSWTIIEVSLLNRNGRLMKHKLLMPSDALHLNAIESPFLWHISRPLAKSSGLTHHSRITLSMTHLTATCKQFALGLTHHSICFKLLVEVRDDSPRDDLWGDRKSVWLGRIMDGGSIRQESCPWWCPRQGTTCGVIKHGFGLVGVNARS